MTTTTTTAPPIEWWTAAEAATYLRRSPRTFRRIARQAGFPLGRDFSARRTCWRRDELEAWADAQTTNPAWIPEVHPGALGPARKSGPMRSRTAVTV